MLVDLLKVIPSLLCNIRQKILYFLSTGFVSKFSLAGSTSCCWCFTDVAVGIAHERHGPLELVDAVHHAVVVGLTQVCFLGPAREKNKHINLIFRRRRWQTHQSKNPGSSPV